MVSGPLSMVYGLWSIRSPVSRPRSMAPPVTGGESTRQESIRKVASCVCQVLHIGRGVP